MQIKRLAQLAFCCGSLLASAAWAESICPDEPQPDCENGQKMAWVKLKANGNWIAKWHKGPVESFGDPTESDELTPSTSYDVCMYVDGAQIFKDRAAAGSEWSSAGPYKVKYKSAEGNIRKMMIKVPSNDKGNSGKGKIKAKGKLPDDFVLPLEAGANATVQFLQVDEEVDEEAVTACWEAVFDVVNFKHNNGNRFHARSKKAKPPKD